jgi:small subunit ribosomal protein S1
MAAMDPVDLAELSGRVMSDATPTGDIPDAGAEMTGTVVGLSDDEVFLEFDAKLQGVMPRSHFGKKEQVEPGRRVDVVVERYDEDANLLFVNRKGAVQRATWTNLAVGNVVEGHVTGVIKGGLEINLNGIRAFMPASQVDVAPMKDISVFLNQQIRCEVIDLDRRAKNVVLSRRKTIQKEQAEARERIKEELEAGQTREGVVANITDFGAFVDIGGVEGLVHIRDLSWGTVEKVSDVLSTGQKVQVKVLKVDEKRERISLGLKQAQPDPWSVVPERYPVGTELKARIIRTADFGAFAELEPGVEGLIPISEMGWERVRAASSVVSIGDLVDAVVIRIEPEKHRLALSMKQAQPDPWAGVLDTFSEQSLVTGRVTRLADFGAFVELAPGVEGLVHISELADRRVRSCSEVVSVGQEVEARVLGVDQENRRISLSLKQVAEPASPDATASAEPAKPKKKRKRPLRGGLTSHFDW